MKLIPTKEQTDIIQAATRKENLAIKAFAGTSKTTTCVMVAKELKSYGLYVAFNKSIAEEATTKFPETVTCKTMHSLAYGAIMTQKFRKKLQGWFQQSDVLDLKAMKYIERNDIEDTVITTIEVIKLFCQSSYMSLGKFLESEEIRDMDFVENLVILDYWTCLINENYLTKITHDIYLKLYQLSHPVLGFDVIYLDEAQDSNEVTLDIILQQKRYGTQLIIVGDSYQAIYAWRGAVDALEKLGKGFTELYLTESFRFTQDIADKAEKIIRYLGNTRKIKGRANKSLEPLRKDRTRAIIVRNNSTLLEELLKAERDNTPVQCLADLSSLWSKLYHIDSLLQNKPVKFPDKELKQYKTAASFLASSGILPELKKFCSLVYLLRSNGGVYSSIQKIKKIIVSKEKSNITLTTAHKSKGLEWDEVTLKEDLLILPSSFEGTYRDFLLEEQTAELLYVAITRARYRINLPETIKVLIGEI